jgi:hypothetical protein
LNANIESHFNKMRNDSILFNYGELSGRNALAATFRGGNTTAINRARRRAYMAWNAKAGRFGPPFRSHRSNEAFTIR